METRIKLPQHLANTGTTPCAPEKKPALAGILDSINDEIARQGDLIDVIKGKVDMIAGDFPCIEPPKNGIVVDCALTDLENLYSALMYNTERLASLRIRLSELI